MSYILDALRRADADRERERGAVPGLHAQPLPGTLAEARSGTPPALWLAAGAGLFALLAALAWWLLRPAPPAPAPTQPAVPPMAARPPLPPAALPQLAPPEAAAPLAATPPPGATPGLGGQAAAVPARPPAAPPAGAGPGSRPAAPPPRLAAAPATAPAAVPAQAAAQAPAAAPARQAAEPAPRAVPLSELPPELRREMPAMSVGGSIYSDSPGNRFVIVNGQVVREGESPAPGVLLERIGPKSAVLRWRELRIEVPL